MNLMITESINTSTDFPIKWTIGDYSNTGYYEYSYDYWRKPCTCTDYSFSFSTCPEFPLVDLTEYDSSFVMLIEVPGFKKEDLEVVVESKEVRIKGKCSCEEKESKLEDGKKIKTERESRTEFTRTMYLSEDVDVKKCTAELQYGVLRLLLPKQVVKERKKLTIKE